MEALPKSVDYSEPLGILPSGTENYNVTCYAVNGGPFTGGSQIIVDLNNVGYLDPASLSIRYKLSLTIPTVAAAQVTSYSIPGCPVYAPILRLDTLFNSNVVESINNYNSVATALSNLNMSISDKMGQQSALGYYEQSITLSNAGVASALVDYSTINENTDGLTVCATSGAATNATTTLTYSMSAPLPSLLSNAEKLIPLNGTNIRLQFTLDATGNVCPSVATTILSGTAAATGVAGAFSAYSISNFEVVYNQIQFPPQVERHILAMPKLRIKTSSYATGLQSLSSGVAGTVNLVYNLRYASIKAMLLLMGSSSAKGSNKLFESIDMTSGNGSYNFQVNGVYYPQNPLSTSNNKSGCLVELRRAMKNMYSGNNSMSIANNEWLATDASVYAAANGSSINVPSKFYVGVNTQKMDSPALFTGVSSQNSPITAIINVGSTPTSLAYSPILMLYYDAIIEVDTTTRQTNFIY